MKNFLLSIILNMLKYGMRFIYFFIKLFPMKKNKITMLSRQSDKINIDFEMLLDQIEKDKSNVEVKVLCKKIPSGFLKKLTYCFYMIKCLYHIATSKICITDGYSIPISSLNHKRSLIIIQIWHAMGAIKQFGRQVLDKKEGSKKIIADVMGMHNNYTYIMCVCEATREIFAEGFGVNKEKILTLGMPRIDYLLEKDGKINQKIEKLNVEYPKLKEKKTILYVPTFRKGKAAHIYDIINAVDNDKYNLIIRLHPLDETKIDNEYIISPEYETYELLKIADYVITDYSAVAFEACVLNKPLFFYLYDIEEYQVNRGLNIKLQDEMSDSISSNIHAILELINKGEYNFRQLKEFTEKYVETLDAYNTERIVEFIIKLMEE